MTPSNNDIIVMSYRPAASCVRAFLVQKFPIYSGRIKNAAVYFVFVLTYVIQFTKYPNLQKIMLFGRLSIAENS